MQSDSSTDYDEKVCNKFGRDDARPNAMPIFSDKKCALTGVVHVKLYGVRVHFVALNFFHF